MNLIPYTTQTEMWTKHFTAFGLKRRRNGLVLLSNQFMKGEGEVKIVSPTAQMVERAKANLKRKRGYGTKDESDSKRTKVGKTKCVKKKAKNKKTGQTKSKTKGGQTKSKKKDTQTKSKKKDGQTKSKKTKTVKKQSKKK